MPITADTIAAGMQQPRSLLKQGGSMAAASNVRGHTHRYVGSGAAAIPSSGINGAAVSLNGMFGRADPAGGISAYLARFGINPSQLGTAWLVDRLWDNSGLSVTSTSAQAITPATLPARDLNGTTDGAGVFAGIEWTTAAGAGAPTVTLTYTNSAGSTGRTATVTAVSNANAGTVELFSLQAGDTGVRAPTSFIQSATRTSGVQHLVLFRILAQVGCIQTFVEAAVDVWTGGRPKLFNGTSPDVIWIPAGATAMNYTATYIETHIAD
jgi:hypothetical protein